MSCRRGDRKTPSNHQRQQLKLLKKGDTVNVESTGLAVVNQVDTFTMKALTEQDGKEIWIDASDIIWKGTTPKSTIIST